MTRYFKCTLSLAISCLTLLNASTAHAQASFQGLGDLPGGSFYSEAYGVSADGTTVVGYSRNANDDGEAFRWQNGTMIGLGNLGGENPNSEAYCVSGEGSAAAGVSSSFSGNLRGPLPDGRGSLKKPLADPGAPGRLVLRNVIRRRRRERVRR